MYSVFHHNENGDLIMEDVDAREVKYFSYITVANGSLDADMEEKALEYYYPLNDRAHAFETFNILPTEEPIM